MSLNRILWILSILFISSHALSDSMESCTVVKDMRLCPLFPGCSVDGCSYQDYWCFKRDKECIGSMKEHPRIIDDLQNRKDWPFTLQNTLSTKNLLEFLNLRDEIYHYVLKHDIRTPGFLGVNGYKAILEHEKKIDAFLKEHKVSYNSFFAHPENFEVYKLPRSLLSQVSQETGKTLDDLLIYQGLHKSLMNYEGIKTELKSRLPTVTFFQYLSTDLNEMHHSIKRDEEHSDNVIVPTEKILSLSKEHDLFSVSEILNQFDSNTVDSQTVGARELYRAVFLGKKELLEKKYRKDLNAFDPVFLSPYLFSVRLKDQQTIDFLKSKGADRLVFRRIDDQAFHRKGDDALPNKSICSLEGEMTPFRINEDDKRCFQFDRTDFVYSKDQGNLMERQGYFWSQSGFKKVSSLKEIDWRERFEPTDVFESLVAYQGGLMMRGLPIKEDIFPSKSPEPIMVASNTLNLALHLFPKSPKPMKLYRGIAGCSQESWITAPDRIWSTAANAQLPIFWTRNGCFIEIDLPAGYPALFIDLVANADLAETRGEGVAQFEFVLPSYMLTEKGDFIPVRYEITKKVFKNFVTKIFDEDLNATLATEQGAEAYIVRPKGALTYDSRKYKSFEEYQKHYVELACHHMTHGEGEAKVEFPALKEMCDAAKKFYSESSIP